MKSFLNHILNEEYHNENPLDIKIDDKILITSKIAAYNVGTQVESEDGFIPYNPKKFPNKAVDIILKVDDTNIELFLDTETKKWDSIICFNNKKTKLTHSQMSNFFKSSFYLKLLHKLSKSWPLSDNFYNMLYIGLLNKEIYNCSKKQVTEDAMVSGDTGASSMDVMPTDTTSNNDVVKNPNGAILRNDVLGKYDPEKGVFGPNDFNLPKSIFKKPLKRYADTFVKDIRKKIPEAEPNTNKLNELPKYLYYKLKKSDDIKNIIKNGLICNDNQKTNTITLFVSLTKNNIKINTKNLDLNELFLNVYELPQTKFYYKKDISPKSIILTKEI